MVDAIDGVARTFATDVDEPVQAEPSKGFFVCFMDALRESRRRQAQREIAKHAHLLKVAGARRFVSRGAFVNHSDECQLHSVADIAVGDAAAETAARKDVYGRNESGHTSRDAPIV